VSLQVLSAIASLPNLKKLTIGRTLLPKIEHQSQSLTNAYNFEGLIYQLRDWNLESLSFDEEMRISMDILRCLPRNIKHLSFVDSFPLWDNNGKDVEWDVLCPKLESISFSFIDADINLWHNLTNRLPLMMLTKFDVGRGFWSLSDKDVLQVLKHLPNIQDIGIFTYQILSAEFFEWANQLTKAITIRTKMYYMKTCERNMEENVAFELQYRPFVEYVPEH
jgi:hypothetical protein